MTRVLDDACGTTGSVVRRYLENHRDLDRRLSDANVAVVIFVPETDYEPRPDYFERVQSSLSAATAAHGRALYVARAWAGDVLRAAKPFPRLDAGAGAFVGFFAVGEGGAIFVDPSGELGAREESFAQAIASLA